MYYFFRNDYLLPSYSTFFNQSNINDSKKKNRHLKSKRVLSSTSAEVLNQFKRNMRRSYTMSPDFGSNISNEYEQAFSIDTKNERPNVEGSVEFENFSSSYPWIGLHIPENVDRSLENVRI